MQIKPFKGPDELPELLACFRKEKKKLRGERRCDTGRKRAKFRSVEGEDGISMSLNN